jgi:hypothetical protein
MKMQEDTVKHILSTLADLIQRTSKTNEESHIYLKNCLPLAESSISFDLSRDLLETTEKVYKNKWPGQNESGDDYIPPVNDTSLESLEVSMEIYEQTNPDIS